MNFVHIRPKVIFVIFGMYNQSSLANIGVFFEKPVEFYLKY